MRGYIYILTNESLKKDCLKIGKTERDPEKRATELASTGVPDKYNVAYSEIFDNCHLAEKKIHKILQEFRETKRREFFILPLQDAINKINSFALEELRKKSEKQEERIDNLEKQANLEKGKNWWNQLSDEWKGFLLERIGLEGIDFYGNYNGHNPNEEELSGILEINEIESGDLPFDLKPLTFLKKIRKIKYEMGGENPHNLIEIINEFPVLENFIYRWSNIENSDNLSSLNFLKYLNLDATPIDNLENISQLKQLTNLSLEQTFIKEIRLLGEFSGGVIFSR